ncbi:MAG: hypothetical protein E7239_01135 [Sarcina sp.]|nr:hypothetical protein [Sarcina sp.]
MSEEKSKKEKKSAEETVAEETVYLQFEGKEISLEEVETAIKENYDSVKKGEDEPTDIKIYLKPEDQKAYYVINCDYAGEVDILVD